MLDVKHHLLARIRCIRAHLTLSSLAYLTTQQRGGIELGMCERDVCVF